MCHDSILVEANIKTISSDIHKLQFIKLHHFELDLLNRSSDFLGNK